MRPFRFAVQLSTSSSPAAWRSTARRIEELGYSTLFIPDHLDNQFGPFTALTVAAEATTTLRVGSLVLGNDYRHPVVAAKELATLHYLSGGRLEFGIGAGWMSSDYQQAGIVEDEPAVRVRRMQEAVEIYRQMLHTGSATFSGEFYTVTNAPSTPRLSSPPPLIIGGGSPKVLRFAAQNADIVGVNPRLTAGYIGPEVIESTQGSYFDERVRWVREAAGDRLSEIDLQILTFFVTITDDAEGTLAAIAGMMGVTAEQVADSPVALVGSVEGIIETLRARRERFGFNYVVVHENEIDSFAPIVAALAGK
jgi:probable F420-dependent oxidoreductase